MRHYFITSPQNQTQKTNQREMVWKMKGNSQGRNITSMHATYKTARREKRQRERKRERERDSISTLERVH